MRIAAAVVFAVMATTAATAEPCVIGTNRPGIDVNPAIRTDPSAARMRCDMTVTERTDPRDGRKFQESVWKFSLTK
jgi:hypothetical protein